MSLPLACMIDAYHGDSFPYPTYAADAIGFQQMVAGGWPFFVSKGSQGSLYRDTKATGRLASAASIPGMQLGLYHFMDDSPIHSQIGNFMGAYADALNACPPNTFIRLIVDNEPNTLGLSVSAQTDKMASMMAQAMYMANNRAPLIYGDASEFFAAGSCGFLSSCPRWLAKYGAWATSTQVGSGWSSWQWQQFSDGATNTLGLQVPGFAGIQLDMSAYYSSSLSEAMQTWSL